MNAFLNSFRLTLDRFYAILELKSFVTYVIVLGIVLRLLWVLLVQHDQVSDCANYLGLARRLSEGYGYGKIGQPSAYLPIGYPFLLSYVFAWFGPLPIYGKLLNILLSLVGMMVALPLVKRLFDDEITAKITILMIAVYPNYIGYSSLLCTEILTVTVLLLGMYLITRPRKIVFNLAGAGVFFGYAALSKPQMFFIPVIIMLLTVDYTNRGMAVKNYLIRTGFLYVVMLFTISPWVVRNYYVFDRLIPFATNGGINFFIGNNENANGTYREIDKEHEPHFAGKSEYERSRLGYRLGMEYIKNNPVSSLLLIPKKLKALLVIDGEAAWWAGSPDMGPIKGDIFRSLKTGRMPPWKSLAWGVFRIINQLYYFVIIGGFLMYFLLVFPRQYAGGSVKKESLMGLIIIVYLTLVYMVFFGAARFHFAMMPAFIMYAAAFLHDALNRNRAVVNEALIAGTGASG